MTTANQPREYARRCAAQAVALLAHAINACERDGATYRYGDAQQEAFRRIVCELIELVEDGEIVRYSTPTEAEHDRGFQQFIASLQAAGSADPPER